MPCQILRMPYLAYQESDRAYREHNEADPTVDWNMSREWQGIRRIDSLPAGMPRETLGMAYLAGHIERLAGHT
jgi:hypothetical protein